MSHSGFHSRLQTTIVLVGKGVENCCFSIPPQCAVISSIVRSKAVGAILVPRWALASWSCHTSHTLEVSERQQRRQGKVLAGEVGVHLHSLISVPPFFLGRSSPVKPQRVATQPAKRTLRVRRPGCTNICMDAPPEKLVIAAGRSGIINVTPSSSQLRSP